MIVAYLGSSGLLADVGQFEVLVVPTIRLAELPEIRVVVGIKIRLIGLLDSDTVLTPRIIAAADALVASEQLPRVLGETNPVTAVVPLPLVLVKTQLSQEVLDLADEQREMPLILANAILFGEDVVTIVVVADGDDTYARNSADDLASALWERRGRIAGEVTDQKRPSRPQVSQDALAAWEPGREDGVFYGMRRGLSRA